MMKKPHKKKKVKKTVKGFACLNCRNVIVQSNFNTMAIYRTKYQTDYWMDGIVVPCAITYEIEE